jgi:hypothetical protein
MSAVQKSKQRISFTDKERQRLREYHTNNPSFTPQQLASWFGIEFGRKVSNSSVYDILSDKYAYLDDAEASDAARRKKGPQWVELEGALFKWWQDVQPREVTGKELRNKANEIWQVLPTCQGKKQPSFSDGWLTSWRARHGLASPTRYADVETNSFEVGRQQEVQGASMITVSRSIKCPILSFYFSNYCY